jgi:hypothetical protein
MTWERAEGGHWQRHCASSPRSSLDLGENDLVEGGGRAVAETLRLSTTLTLRGRGAGPRAETLLLNTTVTSLNLARNNANIYMCVYI